MLCSLLAICRQAVAKLRNEPRLSTDAQGLLHTVLVFMHSLWYPVRECLEPIEERPKDRHQIWLPLAESWEELGLACGLSAAYPKIESPKPWSEQITHFGVIAFSREGCSWAQCLCALDPHHGMKICKGCWPTRQVRYCSHQCQQMYVPRPPCHSCIDYSCPTTATVGIGVAIKLNVTDTQVVTPTRS